MKSFKIISVIKAYYLLNIATILRDKVAMIWPIIFPAVMLLAYAQGSNMVSPLDLRFWWAYIMLFSYVHGIGIHIATLLENGLLKTYFSINKSRQSFFFASLLVQISYIFVCLIVFNLATFVMFDVSFWGLMVYSLILLALSLPMAFLANTITLFRIVNVRTLQVVATAAIMLFFVMLSFDNWVNAINPLYYLSSILMIDTPIQWLAYALFAVFSIAVGVFATQKYFARSNEVR